MSKKILIHIVAIIVILAIGIFVGTKIPRKIATPSGNQSNSFQAGWDAAKERLKQSPMIGTMFHVDAEIKNVNGTIQKIDGNKLTVKINPLEPLADPSLDTRIITVDSNTRISLAVPKNQAQFQKEMQDFNNKMKNQTTQAEPSQLITPPSPFENKEIKLADLKEGQQISVATSEDIKDKKEFTAIQIDAQEIAPVVAEPVIPAPPTAE